MTCLSSSSATLVWPCSKYPIANSIRIRARLRPSGSSDSVTMSRDAVASPPAAREAQPARASSSVAASQAQARHLRASQTDLFMASCLLRTGCRCRHLLHHHGALPHDAFAHAGAIPDLAGELPARRVDIVPPGLAHGGDDTSITEDFRESEHVSVGGTRQSGLRKWIEGDQVDLAGHALAAMVPYQVHQLACMFRLIVDAIEHAVLEGNEVARRMLEI